MPLAYWLWVICDAFHCTPSVAYREWLEAPEGLIEQVIEARNYAAAKDVWDHAKKKSDVPRTPMMEMVKLIAFELANEARAARGRDVRAAV